jgi:hypothetical protein
MPITTQTISPRTIPKLLSHLSSFYLKHRKARQPVPESNLVSDENKLIYNPLAKVISLLWLKFILKGRSVT